MKLIWNEFVEVKSHNDRLSFHQIVWLDKLVEFELDCEVCKVSGKFNHSIIEY